jgi:two-component system NtrC family sensor kinase
VHQILYTKLETALGYLNWEQGNSRPALVYFFRALAVALQSHDARLLTRVMGNIGNTYQQLSQLDSARLYSAQGYALDLRNHDLTSEVGDAATLGNLYAALGNPQQAQYYYYRRSIARAREARITFALCRAYLGQGRLFLRAAPAPTDSALYFGQQALAAGQRGSYPKGILEASQFLAVASAIRLDSAAVFRYLTLASTTRDSLFSKAKTTQMQALDVSERLRLQELRDQQAQAAAECRQLWLLAALASAFPVLLLLWRNNYLRQRIDQRLNSQNTQIYSSRSCLRISCGQSTKLVS